MAEDKKTDLIFSSIGGLILQKGKILKDKFNIFLLFISLLILSVTIYQTFFGEIPYVGWKHSLSWIGLFNWIPLFFCFIGFQPYLVKIEQRLLISKIKTYSRP